MGKRASKRVATRWLIRQVKARKLTARVRLAMSPQYVREVQDHMREDDFSFEDIFGDKLRIAVPVPDLKSDLTQVIGDNLRYALKTLGGKPPELFQWDAEWDWEKGIVKTSDGRKLKIGKLISKAQKNFTKENPETWAAMKTLIKAQRKQRKTAQNFQDYVTGPFDEALDSFADMEGLHLGVDSLGDMYEALFFQEGEKPSMKEQMARIVADRRPEQIPGLGFKAQKLWKQATAKLLRASEEDVERLQDRMFDTQQEIKKKKEEATRLGNEGRELLQAGRSKEGKEKIEEARKLHNKVLTMKGEQDRLTEVVELFEMWGLPEREFLARSIERAVDDLASAEESLHDAKKSYEDRTSNLSSDSKRMAHYQLVLENSRQEYDQWKASKSGDRYLIVSRAPVDVLRMSDHPTAPQAIQSCHSEGGSFFQCAVDEAKGTGLVGYVVDKSDLDNVDLEHEEIFYDRDRRTKGIKPQARIRFRRFEHKEDGSELALPELRTYGVDFDNLSEVATEWARKVQKDVLDKRPSMKDYTLTGGKYRDNADSDLFNNFFGDTQDVGNTTHQKKKKKKKKKKEPPQEEQEGSLKDWGDGWGSDEFWDAWDAAGEPSAPDEQFWHWMSETYPEVPNPNRDGRKKTIAPSTLKSYAEGATPYGRRARDMVQKYLQTYQQQRQQGKRVASLYLLRKIGNAKRKPLVWMDTETTGFNPKKQEILSISMLDEQGQPLIKHPKTGEPLHEVKIKPQNLEAASEQALQINRYSEEAWKDAIPFADVADQIAKIVQSHRLAGHNVAFDRKFVEADLKKAGHDVKADREMVDTMALSFLAGIPSNKLGVTADVLGIPLGDAAHGAYPDTEASRKVWEQLRDPKKVKETRNRMQQQYGGPARGVMFTAMETSGPHPWKDDITRLAIVDHHGRTVFDAELGEGEGKVNPKDAVEEVASIYQDNMFGGDDPTKEAGFVRSFIRKHSPKNEEGKPELKFYSPVLDTATMRHVYGAGRRPSKEGSLADQARAEAETFHEVADKTFGPSAPHRNPRGDFESWAANRTFRHPLLKDDPRRKKDFITYTTLKNMAEKGLGGGEQDVMEKARKRIEALRRGYDAWQQRARQYGEGY